MKETETTRDQQQDATLRITPDKSWTVEQVSINTKKDVNMGVAMIKLQLTISNDV